MKKIPLGAWIFAAAAVVALVFYVAAVRVPEERAQAAQKKVADCSAKRSKCYDNADMHIKSLLELACIDLDYNSKADIHAAIKVSNDCLARGGDYEECRGYYLNRLMANCPVASDSVGIESRRTQDI